MAMIANITMRAAFTTQALGAFGGSPEWDAALRRYIAAEALADADQEFGRYYELDEEHSLTVMRLETEYGKGFRQNPKAAELFGRANEKLAAAETERSKKYLTPFWQAGLALLNTPAPTIAAASFKLFAIKYDEMFNDSSVTVDCMTILEADFARLAA